MLFRSTGPATGTFATTCTPGAWNIERMLQAADAFPMNLGFLGKGNAALPDALHEQINAGAIVIVTQMQQTFSLAPTEVLLFHFYSSSSDMIGSVFLAKHYHPCKH